MMMASLRAKSGGGGKRSGNGRLIRKESLQSQDDSKVVKSRMGHGEQAMAWNASLSFDKAPEVGNAHASSSSTSPETDPGTSDLFPFFKELGGAGVDDGHSSEEEKQQLLRSGESSLGLATPRRKGKGEGSYRNPMFHSANSSVERAVASLFPGEDEAVRAATNKSNPMFNRAVSAEAPARPRPKAKRDKPRRSNSAKEVTTTANQENGVLELVRSKSVSSKDTKKDSKGDPVKKKKDKEKAMYEHVGRMNVRPFRDDGDEEEVEHIDGFRVDTFARNEGESGGKAHFKFVFTVDSAPSCLKKEGEKKSRPVLDAVHERGTGNLRIRVNDGREIGATNSAAVEVALTNVGVVLFNPRTMAKGHHLYTLSLHGRTLFSVLA